MAESRPEVTGSTSEHLPSGPVLNNFRHRSMLVRKPVRRICEIINLVLRVRLALSGTCISPFPTSITGWTLSAPGTPRVYRGVSIAAEIELRFEQ